jgi:ATP-binding cassette, subfamily B, bacterial
LQSPYWRLDEDHAQIAWHGLVRRLRTAAQPIIDILYHGAPRISLVLVSTQLISCGATTVGFMLITDILKHLLSEHDVPAVLRVETIPLLLLFVTHLVRIGMDAATDMAKVRLTPRVRRIAEERVIEASLRVDLANFDDPDFYDRLHRARDRGVLHIEYVTTCGIEVLMAIAGMTGAAVAISLLQPFLLPLLFLAVLPEGWATFARAKLQYAAMPKTIALTRSTEMMRNLATGRDEAAEIRANQAQTYLLLQYRSLATDLERHLVECGVAETKTMTRGHLLSGLGQVVAYLALGVMLYTDVLDFAVAGTAVIAMRNVGSALGRFVFVASEVIDKARYISDYRDFVETVARREDAATGTVRPTELEKIELAGVSFRYPGSSEPAVHNVSFSLLRGQTIALVGENGSGKTTLAKLIAGLYRPTSGCILWNDIDFGDIAPDVLADRIAMVLQDPVRWPRSVRDNIRLGRFDRADPEDRHLLQSSTDAGVTEFVERLPHGWLTLLSREFRGGRDLSGGQWQRLAVARGLYRDAPLVIWDEPTAALDPKAEHAVYASLQKLAQGRAVVLITHRLASIRSADRIFFLERGVLVEDGTHDELIERNGRYAELFRLQARLNGATAMEYT